MSPPLIRGVWVCRQVVSEADAREAVGFVDKMVSAIRA